MYIFYLTVLTIGCGIYQKTNKLKPEYAGLNKHTIISLKEAGNIITYEQKKHILCYLCDTTIEVFKDDHIFEYSTIMIECTFIDINTIERAIERTHINWFQLEPIIAAHPTNEFILFHWSKMYTKEQITTHFNNYLEKYNNLKIWI